MSLRLIAKNTLFLSSAEITIKLIALIFNFVLVRLITVAAYGDYNLINAFVAIFSFLPDLGVNLIAIRDLSSRPKQYRQLVGQTLIVNIVFSLLSFLSIIILFPVYTSQSHLLSLVSLAALTLVVTSLRTVAKLNFDARQAMQISALFTIINALFSVIGSLAGFSLTRNLTGLFAGNLIAGTISLTLEWGIAVRFFGLPKVAFPTFAFIKQGLPLSLAAATALISGRLDILLIGKFLTSLQIGWYTSAQILIISAIQLVIVPLMAAAYPALSKAAASPTRLKALTLKLTGMILIWSLPFTLLTWVLAPPIILIAFGQPYLPAVPTLRLLSLSVPFAALSALMSKILIVTHRQRLYLIISSLGLVISLTTNIFFIPKLGITGAAASAVITNLSLFIIYALSL
jgi:teichuronic acid exporter